ncbi:hypothetical protein [Nannocystis punicea]|uniref:HEAT repeat domain-containing protein n=1 Tax=Nannocystis punicea TaxID=2995304 RepID=A0ABY7H784_9BACT|nr:hypothetical protein [Nannocystis poenicansa]WAS95129.1 hypothetical protein O0S08_03120 [Nannocystis poenicansa]
MSVPILLATAADRTISLAEYVEHVRREVDVRDLDSAAASAPMLAALANDRGFLGALLGRELRDPARFQADNDYISPSFILARGRGWFVRANVWTPRVDDEPELQDRVNFYALGHDHNFSFLTVGYRGPGYETALYEVEPGSFAEEVGAPVELRFIGRTTLAPGQVMLYRASRDVHEQAPPPELSISLNLMLVPPEASLVSQHYFDLQAGRVAAIAGLATRGRMALCRLAGLLGDPSLAGPLAQLAAQHPTPVVRRAAASALAQLEGGGAGQDVEAPGA